MVHSMSPLLVLLGASGRLGRAIAPLAVAAGFTVVAVARSRPADQASADAHWILADLTVAEHRARVAVTTAILAASRGRVCVVDSVLDRSGVQSMRRSVHGATETVLHLRDQLLASGREITLIAASTTAVLAPGLYQTPYGLAKRRQVVRYARSGIPGMALLLPQLTPQPVDEPTPRPVWPFDQAAQKIVAAAATTPVRPDLAMLVPVVPDPAINAEASLISVAGSTILAHLRSLLLDRDSMQAHRAAARGRLRLWPRRIRLRVDHHVAPRELVRRFADRHRIAVIDERSEATASKGNEAARVR
ncbi:hypothetical protein [Solwaraspora sp. WMMA2065]|uniref:hypothetical protein n=1 Tax=Solwaraspora sp. WMMA2065 TaxID=3015166 RepID=UPI00259B1517|nr:hypothetical protein [Solwaraspora sp. WMMA2065]WJK34712.1 hypothetical protein O7610_29770 [Solwaraspora sp. WMMA2065]